MGPAPGLGYDRPVVVLAYSNEMERVTSPGVHGMSFGRARAAMDCPTFPTVACICDREGRRAAVHDVSGRVSVIGIVDSVVPFLDDLEGEPVERVDECAQPA